MLVICHCQEMNPSLFHRLINMWSYNPQRMINTLRVTTMYIEHQIQVKCSQYVSTLIIDAPWRTIRCVHISRTSESLIMCDIPDWVVVHHSGLSCNNQRWLHYHGINFHFGTGGSSCRSSITFVFQSGAMLTVHWH